MSEVALALHTLRKNHSQNDNIDTRVDDPQEGDERWILAVNYQGPEGMVC